MAKFANYVRLLLPGNDLKTTRLTTETLGILARAGGSLRNEIIEFELRRALEWLQPLVPATPSRRVLVPPRRYFSLPIPWISGPLDNESDIISMPRARNF